MPAAVARAGPRDVALPKALNEGFLGKPTPTARSEVAGAPESGDGTEGFVGRPSREMAEVADRGGSTFAGAGATAAAEVVGTGGGVEAPAAVRRHMYMLDSVRTATHLRAARATARSRREKAHLSQRPQPSLPSTPPISRALCAASLPLVFPLFRHSSVLTRRSMTLKMPRDRRSRQLLEEQETQFWATQHAQEKLCADAPLSAARLRRNRGALAQTGIPCPSPCLCPCATAAHRGRPCCACLYLCPSLCRHCGPCPCPVRDCVSVLTVRGGLPLLHLCLCLCRGRGRFGDPASSSSSSSGREHPASGGGPHRLRACSTSACPGHPCRPCICPAGWCCSRRAAAACSFRCCCPQATASASAGAPLRLSAVRQCSIVAMSCCRSKRALC